MALGSQPTGDVTVTITGHADSDLTLSGAALTSDALTFTVTNWNTAQEVTVTAGQDTDTANDDETLTNTATGGGYGTATAATVAVTVVDNDAPGLVVTPTEVRVTEGDEAGASYQISLASAPTGLVLVTITSNSTDVDVTDGAWFTTTDWNNPQTITVTASDDPDLADENVRLNHTVTFGSYAASAVRVQVTVEDDDMPGLAVNPQTLSMVEGASATYDIELTAEPSADVTVTISGHAGTDLTLSGTGLSNDDMLTFTAGNWNQAQSVAATAGQDSDTTDDTATLTHTASGGGYDSLEPVGVPVTIIDDDRPRINVPAAVTVDEADADGVVYAVRLATEPSADVTVTISGHADSDVTLSGDTLTSNALTFTRSIQTTLNWGAPQMVKVTASDDDDTANESVVLTHTATGGDYAGLTAQTEVTVVDDDEPEIILSHSEVTIDEADPDGAVYEVRLATEPSQQVAVEIIAAVGTDLVRTPEALTFDSSSWNTAQAVKVTAPPDVDTMHEQELIVHRGSGGEYDGTTKTVTVIVQDDDIPPGVVIAPTELTVTEGAVDINGNPVTATYTVVLTTQPTADVVVTVAGHADGGDVTVNSSTSAVDLTFTASDWSAVQTVTVAAAADSVAEGEETVTLTHTVKDADSAAEYADVTVASVTVTVEDNDSVGVMIDPSELSVVEGASVDYTVKLTSEPAGDVVVTVSGHAGSGATLSGTSLSSDNELTFTTATWATAQTVTVTGTDDDTAEGDETVTLAHAISSTDDSAYDALADQNVTVTVEDNDSVGVMIDPTELSVVEGASVDYSVKLTSEPAGDVTVTVSGHTGTDLTLSAAVFTDNVLTFTAMNWSAAQTVTVTAAEDDDAVTDADVALAHAVASTDDSTYDALADVSVTVSITEDDAVGVMIDPTTLTVTEGSSMDYSVKLTSEPAGDVTVTVSGHTGTDVALSGTTLTSNVLTFTAMNWSTAQTVTVTAAEDDDAVTDAAVALVHAVASTDDSVYDALADLSVSVAITENDAVGVMIDPTTLTVAEGSSMDYSVKLTSEPAGDVTVTVSGDTGTDVALSGTTLTGGVLTFTAMNWSTAQTVTVTAAEDDDAVTDAAVALVHAVASTDDSVYDALADLSVSVAITENDAVGVMIDPTTLTVAEGSSMDYSVKLTSEPAGDVTVTVSGHTGTDVALSGTTLTSNVLTFTAMNWSTAQTVTVAAAEDDDAVTDAAVALIHAVASTDDSVYDALADLSVSVAITENDAVGVMIDPTTLTVAEGSSMDYSVKLTSEPAGDVTVTVSGDTGTDVALSGTTLTGGVLTFTAMNWSTAQTVTVTAAEDDDAVTDADVALVHAVASTDDSVYDALADLSVSVAITENDAVGVMIDPTTLTVTEGSSMDYAVKLTSEPAGDVTVAVSGHTDSGAALSGTTLTSNVLTFTAMNWSTAQTVTVTATDDDTAEAAETVTLAHAVASTDDSAYDALEDVLVTVTVEDNDSVGVMIDPTELTVAEGSSMDYSVKLTSEPAGDVTVTVSGHSGTDVGLSGSTLTNNVLTFTTANWATAQTVTVTAAEDDDAVTDAAVTLAHAVASTDDSVYDALADLSLSVAITENDSVGVMIDPTELTVTEGSSMDYAVKLTSEPAGDVTVAVSGHTDSGAALSGTTLTSNVLTFTAMNWSTAQTVTVTATDDDTAEAAETVTLAHAVASTDDSAYDALSDLSVTVTVEDNDSVGVMIDPTELTVTEGSSKSYAVKLTSEPAGDVTVAVSGHAGTDVALSGTTLTSNVLTFTAMNWSAAQTVTVTAAEDDDAVTDAAVTLAHAVASTDDSAYDALADLSVSVAITENDSVGVMIDPTELTVTEGSSKSYAVKLTSEPAGDVTVTVSGHSGTGAALSGMTLTSNVLTFTTANWATAQTVTVTGTDDSTAEANDTVTLAHAVASTDDSAYNALEDVLVTVTVEDNDSVGVMIDPTELTVTEGSSKSYAVKLTSEPAGDVTVTVSGHSGTGAALSGMTLTSNVLTFTAMNWSTAQTVTVTGTDDSTAEANETVTLAHAVASTDDSAYDALEDVLVTVTVEDNDSVGVMIDPTQFTVAEGDATGVSYSVKLTSEPAGDVTVTVSGHSGTDVGLSGTTLTNNVLTFTTATWATAQTVTVKAAEDDDAVTDAAVTLAHAVASTDDSAYDALADLSVSVAITENDAVGVMIDPTELTVTEGSSKSYTVKLTSQPAGDVTVTVSGHSGTGATLSGSTLTNNVLTFTTANWATAQTVTVTATDDDTAEAAETVTLAHAVASTDDSAYNALSDLSVTVTVEDNDSVGVMIDPTELTVAEGSSMDYSVKLTSEPAGDVTVTVSGHSGTDVGLSGSTLTNNVLTFTTANWATAQTVTVTAAEDDDAVTDAAVTLAHAVASTDDSVYDALADLSLSVAITENDSVGVMIDPTELTVTEGSSMDYAVKLTSEPAGDVTVAVSGHTDSGAALSGTTLTSNVLTFTAMNWSTAQTVTVTATDDDTAEAAETVTLAHAVASTDDSAYDALSDLSVTVTVEDNDSVGVMIDPTELTVTEGSSKSYAVKLTSEPAGDVTVAVSGHAGTDVALSGTTLTSNVLTFTAMNWSAAQTVTVTAAEDDDAVTDAAVTLAHAVASTDDSAYDALADLSVSVAITENDSVGVMIDPTELTVTEGSSKSYAVKLTSEPAGDVTVTVSGHSGTGAALSGMTLTSNVLTFTTANWATAQTVTVTGTDDSTAEANETVTLAHAVASTDDSAYNALSDLSVTVTVEDNDSVGVMIDPTELTVAEGSSMDYSVKLTSEPAGDVTVTVSGHTGTDVALSGTTLTSNVLTFTAMNWSTAQTVTVTAAEDDDAVTDAAVTLVHAVASTDDTAYNALSDLSVSVAITDNDAVGVTVSFEKDFHRTSEGASGGAFATVRLSAASQTEVTIPINVSSTTTAGTNDYRLSTQPFQNEPNYAAVPVSGTFDVTFEAGDSAVYFAIRALPDTVFENDEKVVLEFGALPAGISTGSPSATTFHLIDTQTVSFGATSYSAIEGGPGATVTVNVDYAPRASAIVCLVVENQAGTSDDDYAGVPDELVFAVTETSRSFEVTVADDADSDGGSIMIGFGCRSGEFREGSPSSTTVNLLDDDPPGGNPGAEGLPAPRGFIATFLTFDGHYYNKTQNSITLLWYPLDRAVQYKLEHRKTADGVDWTVVAGDFEEYTGGGNGPVAVAAGLECDTEYDFRLSAAAAENADASGFGDYAETRARTGPCPEPGLVTNILVAMTPACATLHWTAPLDGRAVAYRVQRTDLGQQPAVTATLTSSTAGTTFRHCPSGGYPPGSGYLFWVAALTVDAEVYGENSSQAVDAGPKGPPNVARNLRFTRQSPQVRSLAWDPPANVWLTTVREATANDGHSDEVADPWVSYVVQRAELDSAPGHLTLVDGTWQDLGEVTGTTFTDRENIGDRIFVYRVLTGNSSGFADGYDPEIWMER